MKNKNSEYQSQNITEFASTVILALAMIVLFFMIGRIITPVRISGHSMMPTYRNGELGIATKRLDVIKTGEVVVIDLSEIETTAPPKHLIVKRVLGRPGDFIDFKDGVLKVNGEVMEKHSNPNNEEQYRNYELQLGSGYYWVAGDNLEPDASKDSRELGPIHVNNIKMKLKYPQREYER